MCKEFINIMKNLIFNLVALIFISSSVLSQSSIDMYNVGEFHNKQMEDYYNSLERVVTQKSLNKITKEDLNLIFKNQTLNVFGIENSKLVSETNQGFIKYFDLKLDENISNSIELIKSSSYNNEELKTFLVNLILESKMIKTENIEIYFNLKLEDANRRFKDKDLEIALISINTGKASFLYWEENLGKWNSLFELNGINSKIAAGPPKTIGAADVGGAAAGALYGAYGGTAFLPGVGTVTGALAVGCAGGMYASIAATAGGMFASLFK